MQLVTFELDFLPPDLRSTAGSAWISLKQHPREENGALHITNHCATFGEIEWQIDYLQKELSHLKEVARRKFASAASTPLKWPIDA